METPEVQHFWGKVCELLHGKINEQSFQTWLKPVQPKSMTDGRMLIQVPNSFCADWIEQHYLSAIEEAARAVAGSPLRISFCIAPEEENRALRKAERIGAPAHKRSSVAFDESQLNPRFTFATFVVGSSNQMTHAACLAVAEKPAVVYNPMFIYGGVGLGKTHIMQAIGHYIRGERPTSRVYYVSSEKFMNEMIDAIQHGRTMEFKRKYRSADMLLIDDVQFLAGKESTQEEFFHTFNSLYDAQKQIVVTSDRPPKEIHMLEERLISRFNGGLVTDIQPPDLETRIAILQKKGEVEHVRLPDDVALLIASHIKSNIRELEGSLLRLLAFASLASIPSSELTCAFAKEVLKELIKTPERSLRIDDIQKTVADYFRLPVEAIKGKRRTSSIVFPRQIAMYVCRKMTDFSLADIGTRFGNRDHTTVLYACDKIEKLLDSDKTVRETIDRIIALVSSFLCSPVKV
ncbi:MAG: chromosomal replication initiator protein DnaA [Candidatus Eisenbacteria bacterium]|nr:chromosomal replication initiator protein DnaA [Candidatus Eisenbacteria bacterium]